MGDVSNIAVEILKQIRDELKDVRSEIRQTRIELSKRIDGLGERTNSLERRLDLLAEGQTRGHTVLVRMADDLDASLAWIRQHTDVRPRLDRCEGEIAAIKERLA